MTSEAFVLDHNQSNATSLEDDEEDIYLVSPDVSPYVYIASCCFMASICMFGVVSNSSIFILFYNSPLIRTPFNFVLMNMVFAEMMIATYGLPVDFTASINFGWKMGKTLCLTTGFILTTSGTVSIMTLSVLSLQRLLTLVNPDKYKITSYRTAFFIIAGIWFYTLFISVPPFFGFGAYVPETSGMTCAPDWESNNHLAYTIYWLIMGWMGPMAIIVYSSVKTVYIMKNQTRVTRSEMIKRMSQKREQKICSLVMWMNIAFFICWTPYGVICILYIIGGEGFVTPTWVVLPLLTAKTSVCWNPILYVAMNPQFRGAFKRFVKTRSEKDMEKRWTRINKNNLAECCKPNESSMINTNGDKINFNLGVDSLNRRGVKKIRKRTRFAEYEFTSRSMDNVSNFTYQPSYSDLRKSFPCQLDMKADAIHGIREVALILVLPNGEQVAQPADKRKVSIEAKRRLISVDVHEPQIEESPHATSFQDSDEVSSDSKNDVNATVIQVNLEDTKTSRKNGWIYGCFEPVDLLSSVGNDETFVLTKKSTNVASLLDNLNGGNGRNNMLNALNLMSLDKKHLYQMGAIEKYCKELSSGMANTLAVEAK